MVKNLPSNAGDTSWIPGRGTKIPHAVGQLSPHGATRERKPASHNYREVHAPQGRPSVAKRKNKENI